MSTAKPEIVSPEQWRAAREELLVKEKAHTRARDALAAERRRMPMIHVERTTASPRRAAATPYRCSTSSTAAPSSSPTGSSWTRT